MYEIFEQLLQKYGYTIYKVSKDTGISQTTLYSWKKNNSKLTGETAKILAKYFGVSIDFLMGEEEKELRSNEFEAQDESERKILMLCRKASDASQDDKNEIADLFESTIDLYLKAKGLKKE